MALKNESSKLLGLGLFISTRYQYLIWHLLDLVGCPGPQSLPRMTQREDYGNLEHH